MKKKSQHELNVTHRFWLGKACPQFEPPKHELDHLVVLRFKGWLEVHLGTGHFVRILQYCDDKGYEKTVDKCVERIEEEVAEHRSILQATFCKSGVKQGRCWAPDLQKVACVTPLHLSPGFWDYCRLEHYLSEWCHLSAELLLALVSHSLFLSMNWTWHSGHHLTNEQEVRACHCDHAGHWLTSEVLGVHR